MELADLASDNTKIDDTMPIKVAPIKVTPIKVEPIKVEPIKVAQDNKKRWLRKVAEEKFEKFLRILFFWENDDKRLGKIIRVVHHFIVYTGIIFYFIIHMFTSSYFIFLLYYIFWGLIWLQYTILGGCISSDIECRLIGDNSEGIILPILDIFHITVTPESGDGVILLSSTLTMCLLSYELISRTISGIQSFFIFK
jgi:hypothetical protein